MKSPARKNECVALCLPRRSRNASSEYGNCRKEKASPLNWMGKKFDSKRINIYQQRAYFAHGSSCAGHRTTGHCALSVMLTVSQLSKSFAGRALFDDVSLQVKPLAGVSRLSARSNGNTILPFADCNASTARHRAS